MKIDINITDKVISEIKKWIKVYNDNLIPKLDDRTDKSQQIKNYINNWERTVESLVITSKNRERNNKFLKTGNLLTHNQALFLLLGLNALELDYSLANITTLNGAKPKGIIETILWETPQNQALKISNFVVNGKITSENLLIFADENDFLAKNKHHATVKTEDRREIVKDVLISFIREKGVFYSRGKIQIIDSFLKALENKGLKFIEKDEDANHTPSKNDIRKSTLNTDLKNIYETDDLKKLRKYIKKST